jgi:hypothetical protein
MNGIRCFELMEDLSPEGTAKAVLLRWNGQRYVRSKDAIEVRDFVHVHGNRGDRGYAIHSEESGYWEALAGLFQQVPTFNGI